MQMLTADVVIVGGGAAGCYAALSLKKAGIKPLIICKGWSARVALRFSLAIWLFQAGCWATPAKTLKTPPSF